MIEDSELLRQYVDRGSEEAFRELFERHARLVYGTAQRVLDNSALAEEATQATFVLLARKAAQLRADTIVAGWLYRTARFVAFESRRQELRRRRNQDTFMELNPAPEVVWKKIEPLIDEAMELLGTKDRDAVVLRFFEGRSFAEVAGAIGTTEAAAKMRVLRALEKLRGTLAKQGVTVPAALLTGAFAAQGGVTLPTGLATATATLAMVSGATSNPPVMALVKGILTTMAWNKTKNLATAAIVMLMLGGGSIGALRLFRPARPAAVANQTVATFEPMAGEWEGTFVMSGNGLPEPVQQNTALTIRTTDQGNRCDIEMRVLTPGGKVGQIYRFAHSLTENGRGIITEDDPSVGRLDGKGKVTTSSHDRGTGDWHAAFVANLPANQGTTECEWTRTADQLTIIRRDRDPLGGGGDSELRLRKVSTPEVAR